MNTPILEPVANPPRTGRVSPEVLGGLGPVAVIDFESTGADPEVDRIVEVAIVRFEDGRRQEWSSLVNPLIPIPPTASAVHHYTDDHVRDAPTLDELASEIDARLSDALVVSHGVEFDSALLGTGLGRDIQAESWLCTYRLARHLYPLAPAFGNDVLRYWLKAHPDLPLRPHSALYDAATTTEILLHMLVDAGADKGASLSDVLDLANSTIYVDYMAFGQYVGVPFCDIPSSYFKRALGLIPGSRGMPNMDRDLRESMKRELAQPYRQSQPTRRAA